MFIDADVGMLSEMALGDCWVAGHWSRANALFSSAIPRFKSEVHMRY